MVKHVLYLGLLCMFLVAVTDSGPGIWFEAQEGRTTFFILLPLGQTGGGGT
jgi:hypothetical protein